MRWVEHQETQTACTKNLWQGGKWTFRAAERKPFNLAFGERGGSDQGGQQQFQLQGLLDPCAENLQPEGNGSHLRAQCMCAHMLRCTYNPKVMEFHFRKITWPFSCLFLPISSLPFLKDKTKNTFLSFFLFFTSKWFSRPKVNVLRKGGEP